MAGLVEHLRYSFGFLLLLQTAAMALDNSAVYEKDFVASRQLVLDGHVREGVSGLGELLKKIDASKEPISYWNVSLQLADQLHLVESYSDESATLSLLLSKNIPLSNPYLSQNTFMRVGRALAFYGKS